MAHPTHDRNFRLSTAVLPRTYAAKLNVHLDARTFEGNETISLELKSPAQEIILHAAELELRSARAGGRAARISYAAESETAILHFDEALPAGTIELEVEWTGRFNPGLRGLYMGERVAVTQFEAADARRVFPSFDEPSFKARWRIELEVPKDSVALSNGAIEEEKVQGDRKRVRFAQTEVLPTYLIALCVGPLASSPEGNAAGIPVRTWSEPDKLHLTGFGQECALAVLPRLQDYFGLPYAFGKLDQVGIPDFEAGAMENAGLITYREVALLVDPENAPLNVQKRIAEVVTHELAHQWFGNWVTMVWWDDLWLNEAFATWMAYKIVDDWKPQWRIWLDFDKGKAAAQFLDALKSTHPIRSEVHNAAEATESFDLITYEKGGAVLRMIEGFLGAESFREGIRQYMKRHARGNAIADDLWRALGDASSEPVLELANAWIRKEGFPLVSVVLQGATVKLTQRRFYSEPGVRSDEIWPVPVVLRYRDGDEVREHRVLLRDRETTVALPGASDVRWVCGNGGNTGFYRVAYDEAGLSSLAGDLDRLEPAERIALLSDTWALVRSGEREISAYLDLAWQFRDEEDDAVLDELVGRLSSIEYRLVADADLDRYRARIRDLFRARQQKIGIDAAADEPGGTRLRRAALVRAMATLGRDPEVVAALRTRVNQVLSGKKEALEANLHDPAVTACAQSGDSTLFDRLLDAFKAERDPAFRRRYLMGLTRFEDQALAKRAITLSFEPTVPLQDFSSFVHGLLTNPTARAPYWEALRTRWSEVEGKAAGAPMIHRRVVESLGNLLERSDLEEVRAHLEAHPHEAARQAARQTLERLEQEVALRERALPKIRAWLDAHH